jgi:hypothetical protein
MTFHIFFKFFLHKYIILHSIFQLCNHINIFVNFNEFSLIDRIFTVYIKFELQLHKIIKYSSWKDDIRVIYAFLGPYP